MTMETPNKHIACYHSCPWVPHSPARPHNPRTPMLENNTQLNTWKIQGEHMKTIICKASLSLSIYIYVYIYIYCKYTILERRLFSASFRCHFLWRWVHFCRGQQRWLQCLQSLGAHLQVFGEDRTIGPRARESYFLIMSFFFNVWLITIKPP